MNEIAILTFLHLLGLVYWLGADLGVFYSSFVLCDDKQPASVRVSAARILFALDQAPRISMTLMLPLGVHLAALMGYITAPVGLVPLVWLVCLGWLVMVLLLHFLGHSRDLSLLTRFDFFFRVSLIAVLLYTAIMGISGQWPALSAWAGWKLAVFGALVACGLIIRVKLKPFGPAFARLVADSASNEDNQAIRQAIGGSRPFVMLIWLGLLLNSALGVHLIQP